MTCSHGEGPRTPGPREGTFEHDDPPVVIIALGVLAILAVALRLAIDLRAIRTHLLPDIRPHC